MPRFKDVLKVGNCVRLRDTCGRCHSCEGSGDNLKAMDDLILSGQCRGGKIGMAEFDCIGDNLAFGVSVDKFEAAVGLQGWTNVKPFLAQKSQDCQDAGLAWMRS
jgi:hypothetical protein